MMYVQHVCTISLVINRYAGPIVMVQMILLFVFKLHSMHLYNYKAFQSVREKSRSKVGVEMEVIIHDYIYYFEYFKLVIGVDS